jgi:hypothetical protein
MFGIRVKISKKPYRSWKVVMPSIFCIFTIYELWMLVELVCGDADFCIGLSIDNIGNSISREDIAIEVKCSEGDVVGDEEMRVHYDFLSLLTQITEIKTSPIPTIFIPVGISLANIPAVMI